HTHNLSLSETLNRPLNHVGVESGGSSSREYGSTLLPKMGFHSSCRFLVHRRGLAGGGDHHGSAKVNFWENPLRPSKWKEEHFVIVSLTGWGLLFYGGYKFFTGGKKDKKEEVIYHTSLLCTFS
ncbi:hypothetical protein CFOL_v3_28802, partial [Cephalotus follicularis]